jgi:hypothetical protein
MSPTALTLATLRSALLMASCSAKTPGATSGGAGGAANPDAASDTTTLDKATFSALIDGEPVSGGAVDGMQQENAAYTILNGPDNAPTLLFYLFDAKVPDDPNFSHSLRFQLPKQVGTASKAYLGLNVILDPTHVAKYNASNPVITITSLTATRLSGTFSGKMSVSPDTPNAPKKEVTVTDGKFDIPMATSKLSPP